VPNEEATLHKESVASLLDRLEDAIAPFTRQGYDFSWRQLIKQSLVTPCCGLATGLSPESATRASNSPPPSPKG